MREHQDISKHPRLEGATYEFGAFQLDQFLRQAGQIVPVTPKSLVLLRTLVAGAGRLVTKAELWEAVWQGRVVTDAAMTVCIAELRKALGDTRDNSAYIATVHKRGYRFVAALRIAPDRTGDGATAASLSLPPLSGRESQLAALHGEVERAAAGAGRIMAIRGGAGMGKTTLVRAFVASLAARGDCHAVVGHCVEQHAEGDAYLPVLEILHECRYGLHGEGFISMLERYAPAWLAHLPGAPPAPSSANVSRERMMLELALVIEAAARTRTLVLVIEDLHWADPSTVAWLDFIGRRMTSCRLLIVVTCRDFSAERAVRLNRLLVNLATLDCLSELTLGALDRDAVATYVMARIGVDHAGRLRPVGPDAQAPDASDAGASVVNAVHRWTGGVPLFVARAVSCLLSRRPLWADCSSIFDATLGADLHAALGPLLDEQLAQLPPEWVALLELASICGTTFEAATLAAVHGSAADAIEAVCASLARTTGLVARAGSTNLTGARVTSRYAFTHELYRQALYVRQPSGPRVVLHRAVALAESRLWGDRLHQVAIRVARHFELGQLYANAAELCLCAGQAALRRAANEEAFTLFQRGIALLERDDAADSRTNIELEIALRLLVGPVASALHGTVHVDARRNYLRVRQLARRVGDAARCFDAEFGLRGLALARGALRVAHRHGTRLLDAAQRANDPELEMEARLACGNTAFQMGQLATGSAELERALALYRPARDGSHSVRFGMDPAMFCLALTGITAALRGDASGSDAAVARSLAGEHVRSHPYSLATAHNFAAWNAQLLSKSRTVVRHASIAADLAARHGFSTALALARIRLGWARAQTGTVELGIAEIIDGITAWQRSGAVLGMPYFYVLLAECHLLRGAIVPAAAALDRSWHIMERTEERWIEAEVWRLRAHCAVDPGAALPADAISHLERAISVAANQGAILFERRAAAALNALRNDGLMQRA